MALDTAFRIERPIAGIVCMSGALNEDELPPLKRTIPVLVIHGTGDDVLPVVNARRTRAVLESHGIDTTYQEFPMAHHVTEESLNLVRDFMAARLL